MLQNRNVTTSKRSGGGPVPSLATIASSRVGALRAGRVLGFMVAWEMARAALGDDWPGDDGISAQVAAYADWWRESERTAWRNVDRFRAAFPGEDTPTRIMAAAAAARWDQRHGVAGLGAVRLAGA